MLFFLFEVCVSYFCQALFIGVMFSCFQSSYSKEKIDNVESQLWWDIIIQLFEVRPERKPYVEPKSGIRKISFEIVSSKLFELIIFLVIVINLITMAIYFESSSTLYKNRLEHANIAFTLIFLIELILKLIAYKKEYFKDSWCQFDFFVVCTGLVEVVIVISSDQNFTFGSLFKAFQVMRVLRVFRVIR